jgi:hypothetical protein
MNFGLSNIQKKCYIMEHEFVGLPGFSVISETTTTGFVGVFTII